MSEADEVRDARILYSCRVIIFGSYFMVLALNVTLTRKIYRVIYTVYATYIYIYTHTHQKLHITWRCTSKALKNLYTHVVPTIYCVRAYYESIYYILLYVLYVSAIDHLNPRGVQRARGNSICIEGTDTLALLLYIYTHTRV